MRSKKLLICLVFLFVSLFAFGFNAKVNAIETSDAITVIGAQVRTTGNAGIRFVATEAYEDARSEDGYGILLAFGEAEADENFVVGGTVNGKVVANAEIATAEDGTFAATLYDIPETMYAQKVSARAYVYADGEYVYSSTVTVRSLADVVKAAYTDGDRSEFVVSIYEKIADPVLNYGTPEYASFDEFVTEILADFKAAGATNITAETFVSSTGTYIKTVFQQAEYLVKYSWLIEFAQADLEINWEAIGQTEKQGDTYADLSSMYARMLTGDTSAINDSGYGDGRTCFRNFIQALITKSANTYGSAYDAYVSDFSNSDNYKAIAPVYLASETVKLAEGDALPTKLFKKGYTLVGWYDNAEFEGEAVATHNGSNNYYAKFTPTNYTITYHLQDGSTSVELVTSYNITTPTFALPTADVMAIEDGSFVGWYNNAAGNGDAITEITLGTVGNIDLYACWEMNTATVVELSANDSAVLTKYTPDLYVLASAAAGKYSINSVEVKFGEKLFASLSDAINAAETGAVIYVFDGSYSLGMTVTKSLTILGPNADLAVADTRADEAVITIANGTLFLNAANFIFNGLTIYGANAPTTGGVYLQSETNLKTLVLQSCVITHGNTMIKFTKGSEINVEILDCSVSEVGQFLLWSNGASYLSTLTMEGCYVDGTTCGSVGSSATSLLRILGGNAKVYNNTFEGAFIKGDSYGGYFNNRGTGTYEIKYNKFVNVDSGSLLSTDTTTTHIFDCNLYLVDGVASTTSLATGLTGTTADTTVCESEQQLAELWATYKAQ